MLHFLTLFPPKVAVFIYVFMVGAVVYGLFGFVYAITMIPVPDKKTKTKNTDKVCHPQKDVV